MSKRIIGLLLVICLCVGLLPVVALADEAEPKKVSIRILSWIDITAEEGGAIGYLKNKEYQGLTPIYEDETIVRVEEKYKGWTQVKGSEDDWNIKLEWPKGGVPTLTLKDAKLDMMGDDGVTFCDLKTDKDTGETWYQSKGSISAILPKSGVDNRIDLNLIVEGDNLIDVNNGIVRGSVTQTQYFKNINITGKNGGKISGTGRGIGISARAEFPMVLDGVTLDLKPTTSGGGTPVPIRTEKADLTIKNSNITCANEKNVAIAAMSAGNINIIDSTINVTSRLSSTAGPGCIYAQTGTVTIDGDKTNITAVGQNNACIYGGKAVIINGGDLKLTSSYYALYVTTKEAEGGQLLINGGTVEVIAERACWIAPVLGKGVVGYAGANKENCESYDGSNVNLSRQPWMLMTNKDVDIVVTQPTENAPIFVPTTPSTTATTPTQATTGNNAAPTVDAGTQTDGDNSTTILLIVAAAVVLVAGAAVAVIIIKRKKA